MYDRPVSDVRITAEESERPEPPTPPPDIRRPGEPDPWDRPDNEPTGGGGKEGGGGDPDSW